MKDNFAIKMEKEIVYYEALINAWIATRRKRDECIFVLSVIGAGVLIALSLTVSDLTHVQIYLLVLGDVAFLTSIICVLSIFKTNSSLIESIIHGNKKHEQKITVQLLRLDNALMFAFFSGFVVLFSIALSIAIR